MNTAGNQEMIRITNQTLILDLIREKGLISRADIAKLLNLSPPSTSSNISRLLDMNIIREVGEGVSCGGRKPILLELNKEYGYIIAIDMSCNEIRISLGNICAEVIDGFYFKMTDDSDGIRLLISIISNINILLDRNRIEKDRLKAIVIGAPGVYDSHSHRFLASRISNWQGIDAEGALQVEYNTQVIIKNDIGMAALGEYVFGLRKSCSCMIYINADSGIGAGLILDGQLYEGQNGAAGLISSMTFSKDNIGGIYKRYGYLETMVSADKLVQKIRNLCKNDRQVLELCGGDINRLDFGLLKRAYERNHIVIKSELDKVVDLIAISIGNINTLLDIEAIILGGRMATLGEYFLLSIKRVVGELCAFTPYITHSVLKDNSVTYGLFAAGQQYIFDKIA